MEWLLKIGAGMLLLLRVLIDNMLVGAGLLIPALWSGRFAVRTRGAGYIWCLGGVMLGWRLLYWGLFGSSTSSRYQMAAVVVLSIFAAGGLLVALDWCAWGLRRWARAANVAGQLLLLALTGAVIGVGVGKTVRTKSYTDLIQASRWLNSNPLSKVLFFDFSEGPRLRWLVPGVPQEVVESFSSQGFTDLLAAEQYRPHEIILLTRNAKKWKKAFLRQRHFWPFEELRRFPEDKPGIVSFRFNRDAAGLGAIQCDLPKNPPASDEGLHVEYEHFLPSGNAPGWYRVDAPVGMAGGHAWQYVPLPKDYGKSFDLTLERLNRAAWPTARLTGRIEVSDKGRVSLRWLQCDRADPVDIRDWQDEIYPLPERIRVGDDFRLRFANLVNTPDPEHWTFQVDSSVGNVGALEFSVAPDAVPALGVAWKLNGFYRGQPVAVWKTRLLPPVPDATPRSRKQRTVLLLTDYREKRDELAAQLARNLGDGWRVLSDATSEKISPRYYSYYGFDKPDYSFGDGSRNPFLNVWGRSDFQQYLKARNWPEPDAVILLSGNEEMFFPPEIFIPDSTAAMRFWRDRPPGLRKDALLIVAQTPPWPVEPGLWDVEGGAGRSERHGCVVRHKDWILKMMLYETFRGCSRVELVPLFAEWDVEKYNWKRKAPSGKMVPTATLNEDGIAFITQRLAEALNEHE